MKNQVLAASLRLMQVTAISGTGPKRLPNFYLAGMFLLLVLFAQSLNSQTISGTTYPLAISAGASLEDMSSGTTTLVGPDSDDGASALFNIGFDYWFVGVRHTQFSANANGLVRLGTAISGLGFTNSLTSITNVPEIATYWDDLWTGTNGKVHYKTIGSAPNRKLVVEWLNMQIPRVGAATPGAGIFQLWLNETTGRIEFVYGTGVAANAANSGYSVGFNTSASLLASISTLAGTISYVTANNTQTDAISNGTKYTFTPLIPAAPTGLNFTAVGAGGMTLNWTDIASNEVGYAIYRSTDGINYTFMNQTAANATSSVQGGLSGSTLYFWKVYAITEGGVSTSLDGSQSTTACALTGTYDVGPGAVSGYLTLKAAVDAVVIGGVLGTVVFELNAAYTNTTDLTFPIVLGNVPCANSTNTITIRPAAGAGPKTITSPNIVSTLDINGGNYWIIDGQQGGIGGIKDLTIDNSSTSGVAIRYINDASNNVVKYSIISGVNTSATNGVVVFSTTTGPNGNDNNTIENCDIKDGATTPANGIYSSGTTTTPAQSNSGNTVSNCNLFNFYQAITNDAAGIRLDAGNTDWIINANSFYQTATRTTTGGTTARGIYINNASGNNFSITNNFIGGGAANAGGTAWTVGGSFANRFEGIRLVVGTTTASSVQNNTISNFAWTSSSGVTTLPGVWIGIYISSGNANIGTTTGNTIGASTGTGAVNITISTTGGVSAGIGSASSTSTVSISNNNIGSITLQGSGAAVSHSFNGIWATSGTTLNISSNTIGSTSTANSINYSTAGTGTTAAVIHGIFSSSAASALAITNNTIANLNSSYVPAAANTNTVVRGIISSSGVNTIVSNTIRNLSTAAQATGTAGAASVIGISLTSTTAGTTVSQNTIHSLSNTHASAATLVHGLYYSGATTGTNTIARNFIHSLSNSSTSASAEVNGIRVGAGTSTYRNNIVAIGAGISNAILVSGINEPLVGTDNFFHNSIYIGGSPTAGTANSFAFNSTQVTSVRSYRDNIFVNARSNSGATGKNYAVRVGGTTPNPTGLTTNNNVYHVSGTGTVFGLFNGADVSSLSAWQSAVGQDASSVQADPQYIDPANSIPDLHIHPSNPSPAEGSGADVGVTDDFDGQTRSGLTPVDIGADAGNFVPLPSMLFVSCTSTQTNTSSVGTNSVNQEVIGIQVVTSGTFSPLSVTSFTLNTNGTTSLADIANAKIFYTGTSSVFATTTQVGSTVPSPSGSFMITGSQTLSDGINYFWLTYDVLCTATLSNVIDAECNSITVGSPQVPTTQVPTGSRTIVNGPLNGTYTIGAGGSYLTLTAAVDAVNTFGLAGNTIFVINDDLSEAGGVTINQLTTCGGSGFMLTIKPATATTRVITANSATAVINLNGADNIFIDGFNGTNPKNLTIRNTGTGPAIRLINDATANLIRNSVIESQNTSITSGTILFSTSTGSLGNSNNTVANCDIRDRSDAAGIPANGIYSSGTVGALNAGNAISGCNVFNWTNAGVLVSATGAGNGWTVNPSSFYQTAARTTPLTAISIQGGSGHIIMDNMIGGTAPNAGGTHLATSSTFRGIDLTVGITSPTSVQGNTIKNIRSTVTGFTASYGIFLQAGMANIGTSSGNTVGSSNVAERFEINGDSYGIRVSSTSTVNIRNNTINNFGTNASPSTGEFYWGMLVEGTGGSHTVVNNTIANVTNSSVPDGSFDTQTFGLFISATGIQTVSGNTIHDIGSTSLTAPTTKNNRVWGLIMSATPVGSVVGKNKIYNIYASSAGAGARVDIITLLQSQLLSNATYSNNMVSGSDLSGSSDRAYFGILDLSAAPSVNNYYFNSVNIYGTATGANPTYAFNRNNTATVTIRDNIFNNSRSGGTGFHVAIANTNAAATGWLASASDYNDLFSSTSTNLAQWLGSAVGNNRDLAGWQASQAAPTPGSGGDAMALSVAPVFASNTDLHLTPSNGALDNFGTPFGGIADDIDSQLRHATMPDMGADEFSAGSCANAAGGTAAVTGPSTFCGSGTPTITASGYSTGLGSGYQWMTSTMIGDYPLTGTPVGGQTNPASLTTGIVTETRYYWLRVTCTSGMLTDYSNMVTITVNQLPTASVTPSGPVNICAPATQLLTASTNASSPSYQWKKDGVNVGGNSNTYTATATGTYTVIITDGVTTCFNTSNAVMVTINAIPPAPMITPSSASLCSSGPAQLLTASGGTISGSVTVSSGPLNLIIPDDDPAGLSHGLLVSGIPAGSTIDSAVITVNISHTWVADLTIIMTGPNALTEDLSSGNGGSGDNYTNTRITSDPAKPSITTGTAPFTGTFKAEGTLSNLFTVPNGTWTLNASDDAATDEGTLLNWSVKIYYTSSTNVTWSITPGVYTGLYTDAGAMTPYAGEITNTVYALPATTTTYTATATTPSGCSNTSTVDVFINGLQVQNNNNNGGGSLRDVIGCATPGSTVTFAPGLMTQTITLTGGEIEINKNLTISGLGMLNLTLSGNNANRIFHLKPGNNLKIENLALKNTSTVTNGGAMLIEGALILENALLQNNLEGGVPKAWTLLSPGTVDIQGNVDVKN